MYGQVCAYVRSLYCMINQKGLGLHYDRPRVTTFLKLSLFQKVREEWCETHLPYLHPEEASFWQEFCPPSTNL